MNLKNNLITIITSQSLEQKITLGLSITNSKLSAIAPLSADELKKFSVPGRPKGTPIVEPRKVSKRNFQHVENRINFLHAIAHIELLAIELPCLCLLRFGTQNLDFLKQQLKVISEEAKHFNLLNNRLESLKAPFGSKSIHMGLWDYALKCQSEIEHQIVIPCFLEARGLDVCPEFIQKFNEVKDTESASIMQTILDDEIGHVQIGLNYLEQKANESQMSADELFTTTLSKFFKDSFKSKIPINRRVREQAGFSKAQLNALDNNNHSK